MVIRQEIEEVLQNTYDPELGIDLVTLGLIYKIDFDEKAQSAKVTMTFTTPLCPFGPQMVGEIKSKIRALGIEHPEVEVVFEPPWEPSEEVRSMLGV